MSNIHKFSDQVIDYAERLSNMADAASGKGVRKRSAGMQWLLLPAAGAGLVALVKSDFVTRQAKGVVEEAKTRAAELPDDLLGRVRQTSTAEKTTRSRAQRPRRTSPARKTSSAQRSSSVRKTSAGR